MKLLLAVLLFGIAGCSSYLRDTKGIAARLDHHIEGKQIALTATITNNTKRSITFVRHPDFAFFSLWARNKALVTEKNIVLISYYAANLGALETVKPGGSITFEQSYGYQILPNSDIRIRELPEFKDEFLFTMRDNRVVTDFSYGFYADNFPFLGRFLRSGIVLGDIETSKTIQIK